MPYAKTTRSIKRQALQTIHHPPSPRDKVTVSKENQLEKAKMVRELIPFLTYLYKKYMGAQISEGTDLDMLKLLNKAMRQMPNSPAQKKTLAQLNKLRKSAGMQAIGESTLNEIPMGDLQKIDTFADKKLNPVDVVLTDRHFFDRLNDPRNGKEISQAELIGFFKRLGKKKKEFVDFLNKYNSLVAVDDRTNINIPFMKQANKAIAKTVMRKKDFKTPDKKLDI